MNGALLVSGDITSTGDIGCTGVLATQLTVSGTGSSIPGYQPTAKYAQTTDAQAYTSVTGTWHAWNYNCSFENHIGNGHALYSATSGFNTVASETVTYLKKNLSCYVHVRMSNTHGYFDSYALLPSGQEVFISRINAHQDVDQSYIQIAGPSFQFRGGSGCLRV